MSEITSAMNNILSFIDMNQRRVDTSIERLSSGARINGAADDAAGLAIHTRLESRVIGMSVAVQNAGLATSLIGTLAGSLGEIKTIINRMRELSVQAANGTLSDSDRDFLDKEFQDHLTEMRRIADNTEWNGKNYLNSKQDLRFFIGDGDNASITLTTKNFSFGTTTKVFVQGYGSDTANLSANVGAEREFTLTTVDGNTVTGKYALDDAGIRAKINSGSTTAETAQQVLNFLNSSIKRDPGFETVSVFMEENGWEEPPGSSTYFQKFRFGDPFGQQLAAGGSNNHNLGFGGGQETVAIASILNVDTSSNATTSISVLDGRLKVINDYMSELGALTNTLSYATDYLSQQRLDHLRSQSRIVDTDYATEVGGLTRAQILQDSSLALLAQANLLQGLILKLL